MNAFAFAPHLASAWRISCQEVAEALRFIRVYRQVLAEEGEMLCTGTLIHSAGYVAFCRRALPEMVERYREQIRICSEAEQRMSEIGMPFAVSSDHWSEQ